MAININGTGSITGLSSISSPTISGGSVPLGDATAPGIVFSGDANTGIYSPGADQVAISTNGTGRLFVNSSGSVGIGSSSPGYPLTVNGRISYAGAIGEGADTTLSSSSTTLIVGDSATWQNLALKTNGSNRVYINAAGSVGIGTTSANVRLHVNVDSASETDVARFQASNGADVQFLDIGVDPTGNLVSYDATGSTGGAHVFRRGGGEVMRLDDSSRLLVGTSSARDNFFNTTGVAPGIQLEGTSFQNRTLSVVSSESGGSGGLLVLAHQKSGTIGGNTVLASGDAMGVIDFQGSDGTEFVQGARIACEVDGTPGANDMPGRLVFSTTADGASSPTERLRINSAGALFTYTTDGGGYRFATSQGASTDLTLIDGLHSASGVNTGTAVFKVRTNGNVQNTNNSYGSLSDLKLKENIVDAASQWDDLKALQVRKYNFKEGQTHTQIGLIAQEVELVSPGLVSESPDRDEDGNDLGTVTKSVNYSVLYMKAVKALQEAMERIETLEAKVAALESA